MLGTLTSLPSPNTTVFRVLIFILVLVTHVHTTGIQCMQTLSMYSMGQMLTRACTFKGTLSNPLKYNRGGRPRHELVSSCRRAPCRWSRAGAASSWWRPCAYGRRQADAGHLTVQQHTESHVPMAPKGHGDPVARVDVAVPVGPLDALHVEGPRLLAEYNSCSYRWYMYRNVNLLLYILNLLPSIVCNTLGAIVEQP